MFNCSCCGKELTSPYFYDGGVYGWSCIRKVKPNAVKNKGKCFLVDVLKIKWRTENSNLDGVGYATVSIAGKIQTVVVNKIIHESLEYYTNDYRIGNFEFYKGKYWGFF